MKSRTLAITLLGSMAVACAQMPPSSAPPLEAAAGRQILVTVHQPSSAPLGLIGNPSTRYVLRRDYGATPAVERTLNRIAREHAIRRVRGWRIDSLDVYCEVYELSPGQTLPTLLRALEDDPRIDIAQPMNVFETQGSRYNDPYAAMQVSVALLSVEPAHQLATGRGVTVAVIDSQIDTHHPELRSHVRMSRDLVADGILRADPEIHGTAIAGIIASTADNTEGIVGIAPDVELVALRACEAADQRTAGARCSSFSLAQALEIAVQIGADVINLSLSGPADPLLGRLIDAATANGAVVVAALPEDDSEARGNFPASHPGVIAVGSSEANHSDPASNSVEAPGREILTTIPRAGYAFFSGNSMAAAHISGIAALLIERRPLISTAEVLQLLADTGTRTSVNACRAVARLAGDAVCEPLDIPASREALLRTRR